MIQLDLWSNPARCVASLKSQVAKIDGSYDKCNEAWTKGEAEGFFTETFLDPNMWKTHWFCFPDFIDFMVKSAGKFMETFFGNLSDFEIKHIIESSIRFHKLAEDKMKEATYVCKPYSFFPNGIAGFKFQGPFAQCRRAGLNTSSCVFS